MPKKNYYLILGVSPHTSTEQIRSAFRRLAKKHHPDKTGDKETSPFHEITEAYETLSDPEKRKGYNQKLEEEKRITKKKASRNDSSDTQTAGRYKTEGKRNTRSIFDYMKSRGSPFFRDIEFGGNDKNRLSQSNTLEFDVYLTPSESARGESLEIDIPASRFSDRIRIDLPSGIKHGEILRARVVRRGEKNLHIIIHVHIFSSDFEI